MAAKLPPPVLKQRALRFAVSGGVSTGVHVLVATLVMHWLPIPMLANAMAFLVATVGSYLLNTLWSFQSPLHGQNLWRYCWVAVIGLMLTTAIAGLAQQLGFNYLIGIAGVVCIVPPITFLLHHFWTYRPHNIADMKKPFTPPIPITITNQPSWAYHLLTQLILLTLAMHRLRDFVGLRYATADNIDFSVGWFELHKLGNPLKLGLAMAQEQGRLTHIVMTTVDALVSMIPSQLAYDFLNMGSFSLALILLSVLISRVASSWLAYIFLALVLAGLPQLWQHTPPAAYPVWPWLPWISFALAGLLLLRYMGGKQNLWLGGLAGLCYAASFFSLELFVLVFPVCALALIRYAPGSQGLTSHEKNRLCLFTLVIPVIYVACYAGFRWFNPSQYDGNRIGEITIANILSVFYQYSIGGFSLYYILRGKYPILYNDSVDHSQTPLIPTLSLPDAVLAATGLDWLAAILSGVVLGVSLWQLRNTRLTRRAGIILVVGVWIAFASLFLYGISEKYAVQVQNVWSPYFFAYIGTRYAYFGWILVFASLLAASYIYISQQRQRWGLAVLLAGCLGILSLSLVSSYFNRFVTTSMRIQTAKWQVIDLALSCQPLWAETNTPIYAPRLNSFVWWSFIRPNPSKQPEIQRAAYWNQYALSRGLAETPRIAAAQTSLWLDYRLGVDGSIIGIVTAHLDAQGKTSEIRVLSPRNQATQMWLNDLQGQRLEALSWNATADSCGNYKVNRLSGKEMVFSSITLWSPVVIALNNPIPQ